MAYGFLCIATRRSAFLAGFALVLAGCASSPEEPLSAAAPQPVAGGTQATTANTQATAGGTGIAVPTITGALGGISAPQRPVAVYTNVARKIHTCWLRRDAPALKQVKFYAKTKTGEEEQAEIHLFRQKEPRTRGTVVYSINISRAGEGSAIFPENMSLDQATADHMNADLERWIAGEDSCAPANNGIASANAQGAKRPDPAKQAGFYD